MREEKIKKQNVKILAVIISVIYLSIFVVVTFRYINENRYWEIKDYATSITAEAGQNLQIKAKVKNKLYYVMDSKDNYYISYHLYNESGGLIKFDNMRTALKIKQGNADYVNIQLVAPNEKGNYKIKIDIVKEGEYWFEDRGDKPGLLQLTVS